MFVYMVPRDYRGSFLKRSLRITSDQMAQRNAEISGCCVPHETVLTVGEKCLNNFLCTLSWYGVSSKAQLFLPSVPSALGNWTQLQFSRPQKHGLLLENSGLRMRCARSGSIAPMNGLRVM